jgi:hypothetical protein
MASRKLLLLGVVVLFTGCNRIGIDPTNREAQKLSAQYRERAFVKCGDEYYSYENWINGPSSTLTAYKGLSVTVTASQVSEVERLNGIEWNGTFDVQCVANRTMNSQGGWPAWSSGCILSPAMAAVGVNLPMKVHVTKRGGRWYRDAWGGLKPIEEYKIRTPVCGD